MKLEPVIGLEIHIQLKTKSKMFCPCDNTGEDKPANTTVCPICMGHPGTLPVPNSQAIHLAGKAALALNLRINERSKFDRKNYFYPDLPKGYQISQYDEPFSQEGWLEVETKGGAHRVGIERLHLEEDTAKLWHVSDGSLVDFNRSGTPLMEIVTKPEVRTPEEAKIFLQELRLIMRYIGASDADMEKGHLRCDANISLRPEGEDKLYPKTEVKNLNSFRSVERALEYEIGRQTKLWEEGGAPTVTGTRGWNDAKGETVAQREKEAVHDYRYFPEPDIPPLAVQAEEIEVWRNELPELPQARRKRLAEQYGLKPAEAKRLTDDRELGDYVEQVGAVLAADLDGDSVGAMKLAANWAVHKLSEVLAEKGVELRVLPFSADTFVQFLLLVARRQVNSTNAQVLLRRMVETGKDPNRIVQEEDLAQSAGGAGVAEAVSQVITTKAEQVLEYRGGKTALLKFFVGLVMKETKGKSDPAEIEAELKKQLDS